MSERVKVTGRVRAVLRAYKDGPILRTEEGDNLVVTVGKALLSGLVTGLGVTAPTYMALGTGVAAAAAGDTTLGTEIATAGGERKAATVSQETTTTTDDTARYIASYSFTGSFSVSEAGLFTAVSAGTLLSRKLFGSPIAVVNGNVLEVTWDVVFG